MIAFFFITLNLTNIFLYFTKRHILFIFVSLIILFVEPAFQKLLDVTLFGDTYNVFGFDRLKTNLIIISSFTIILFFRNRGIYPRKHMSSINNYAAVFILFHIFNVLFSENLFNSLAIFIVGIIGPACFFYLLMGLPENIFVNNEKLLKIIYFSTIFFLFLGVVMYNSSVGKLGFTREMGIQRTAGGLWLSNISTQILALFFPFIFSRVQFKFSKLIKFVLIIMFIILLSISMSRTGLMVYTGMLLLIFRSSRKTPLYIIFGVGLIFGVLNFIEVLYRIDIVTLYTERFFTRGNVIATVGEDPRLMIYKECLEIIKGNEVIGTGISSFSNLNKGRFSNAHNIFLNIFVERGVIGLFLIFFLFYFIFTLKINNPKDKAGDVELLGLTKIGVLGFLSIGFTGNDMFVNSGFINGWAMYIILFLIAIQLKKIGYLKEIQSNV